MNKQKDYIRLIDRLYKDLYKDKQVLHHGKGNEYDKFNNIKRYLEKLEDTHNKVKEKSKHIEYLKKCYYEKYVIKKENIPQSYYEKQKELALERGFGHVEITDEMKKELEKEVIENQKKSMDRWLDYFLSDDAKVYPFWAKYWAFQGMLKIGKYDKEKQVFYKRDEHTVSPFCDLNREALSKSIDMIIKAMNKEEIDDKDLEGLVRVGSFPKIYTYILTKVLSNNKNIIKRNIGKWVKYEKGSNHMPLVNSLQGYNTGWCTAGEDTAKNQLFNGDFYVYYTLDEKDEYKVPRIAIRMEGNKIGEIRGVAENQNIESEMEEVVEEKIKDFPDKEEYYKKVNDMKKLTKIYKKHKNKEELTKEELTFLYEINDKIYGFGYGKDPRIKEIKNERNNKRKDLLNIFNCEERQIALNQDEINEDTIYYDGDLSLSYLTSAKGLKLPQNIGGSLNLRSLTSAEGLVLPQRVGGDLYLSHLTSAKGLVLPQSIGESLYLNSLTRAEGLVLPQSIGHSLYLNSLTSAEGLVLPQSIGGSLSLDSLTSAEGLKLPQSISGDLDLNSLTSAKGLVLPQRVSGYLDLSSLTSAEGLKLPQNIGGSLNLRSLTSAEGLVLPQNIGGSLYLRSLTSAKGLVLPQRVSGNLDLGNLTSAEGLKLPQSIGGSLSLDSLTSAKGLALPQSIGGYLDLSSLTSAEGLALPQSIGGYLDLSSLTSAEGLVLPQSVGLDLYLSSLTSADGLIIPEPLTYTIHMKGFKITLENVEQYRKSKSK